MTSIPLIDAKDLLATLTRAPFARENWLYELNYDGYRCLARKVGRRVELISRQGNMMNPSFPDIVEAVSAVPGDFVWDAELTVDEMSGKSSFERLQLRAGTKVEMRVRAALREHPARLYVFDMLAAGARDLRALPLFARKEALRDSFENAHTLAYVTGVVGAGAWVFEQVEAHDFEGMVAKRLDAPYQRGRSNDWLKIKYASYSRPAALGWGRK
ncbi:DNA ligase [Caballeronia sp. INML1]|uniref:ATP-dependent DNA ligase n=1 Tax=Caballeronia sp. INML1 TaxID=2921760 RepID=UPI002028EE85|nr:DNA ligase [Caballeronia sp. INML1]